MVTARFTAVPRSDMFAELASMRRILHVGQIADAMSRSREISPDQPASDAGSGLAWPFWFTFLKQPFAVVHAGRPKLLRYLARSASALGLSIASTMAMVAPA